MLQIRHVKNTLHTKFDALVDMSDVKDKDSAQREIKFLSRALAAYAIHYLGEIDAGLSAKAITDNYDDNGIDAIYHDTTTRTLWIVQSKWIEKGKGCPDLGDVKKFTDGIGDLINEDYARFNSRVQSLASDISNALNDTHIRIRVVLTYTGETLSSHQQLDITDLMDELNTASDLAEFTCFNLSSIHRAISGLANDESVKFDLPLMEWGIVESPHKAFYGKAACSEIARIGDTFQARLFHRNIRQFLGDTAVTAVIQNTVKTTPENFFYFNNGITIIAKKVAKKATGGNDRRIGIFECESAHVVNGAQTVGSLSKLLSTNINELNSASVFVRLISLETCPPEYATELTRATNTQNRIERRDFVSLDPEQERIRQELFLDLKKYIYKTGDKLTTGEEGCDLQEATVALACRSANLENAILAKKEIGKLWENIAAPPYNALFNSALSGSALWRAVSIKRLVDSHLRKFQIKGASTNVIKQLSIHANNIVSFIVFSKLSPQDRIDNGTDITSKVNDLSASVFDALVKVVNAKYKNAMISRIFYNITKTKHIVSEVRKELGS